MNEVTQILSRIERGDATAAEQLLPMVYDDLRVLAAARMAEEPAGQTLQATALVHEAYLRLVQHEQARHWKSRRYFFGAAARAMRRILIENLRRKSRQKHGGDFKEVDFDHVDLATELDPAQLLILDEAVERLSAEDELAGEIVKLRYFAGLSVEESARALDIATSTAYRHWTFARAWLVADLLPDTGE